MLPLLPLFLPHDRAHCAPLELAAMSTAPKFSGRQLLRELLRGGIGIAGVTSTIDNSGEEIWHSHIAEISRSMCYSKLHRCKHNFMFSYIVVK